MEYEKLLLKLGSWISVIRKSILFLTGIETVMVLVIGVASSNIYHDKYSIFWISILIVLGFFYMLIAIFKIAYNASFPNSIVDELKAKKELELLNKSVIRKDAINNYISSTVIALSTCKCEIPKLKDGDDWEKESDKDLLRGLKSLTITFNSILNTLLDTPNIKFTTGVYIESVRAIKHENRPDSNGGVYLLRDDFDISTVSDLKSLMRNNSSGAELEIQNAIRTSFNNGQYLIKEIISGNAKNVVIICSNIEELIQNTQQKGVLFIITDSIENIPEDLESVLRMFTNLISHWLDLYFHEVRSRQISLLASDLKSEEEEEENNA